MPIVLSPSVAAAEGLIVDPTSEDATNAQLDINDGSGYVLLAHDYPEPDLDPIYASSADTEGDIPISVRPKNRVVSVTVNIYGSSALDLDQKIGVLSQKVGKLNREGGTFKRTTPSGLVIVFDVLPESSMPSVTFDKTYQSRQKTTVSLRFTCQPYGRGPESAGTAFGPLTGDFSVVLAGITGDVPALGRVAVTEGSSKDQWHAHWGVRSRYYDATATAALGFEAESCTLLGGATVVTLAGSSGGGTNNAVEQGTLTLDWQAMLSFQATGGGAYKSHIGDYEVMTRLHRPTSNTGAVSVALEWAEGDFTKVTRNDALVYAADEREGDFTIARLGQVHLSKAKKGTQRWDGRIIAKSTVLGDDLRVDRIWLRPISEGAGEVTTVTQVQTPTAFSARDEFDQTAGALGGKTAAVGGVYTARGTLGASDLTVDATNHYVTRTALSDGIFLGRGVTLPVTMTDTIASLDTAAGVATFSFDSYHMLMARYVDEANFLGVTAAFSYTGGFLLSLDLFTTAGGHVILGTAQQSWAPGAWITLRLRVDSGGQVNVWWGPQGGRLTLAMTANHSALATGGVLASGLPGFRDARIDPAVARTRYYDNLWAASFVRDAVLFSGRQAEIRSDGYTRQDSTGTVWGEKTVDGDYLLLPCAGREGRSTELQLRVCRNDPDTMTDPALDSVSGTVYYTPRYRNVPT
jgi:hypothetical protein